MSILFFGDPHGDFDHIIRTVQREAPTSIVLLGDMEAPEPLDRVLEDIIDTTDIYWIHGNHDIDRPEFFENLYGSSLLGNCLHGRVVEVDAGDGIKVRIAGLGGTFEEEVWLPPNDEKFISLPDYARHIEQQLAWRQLSQEKADGLLLKAKASIFYEDWFNLCGQQADILITHEAPSCHPHGYAAIDALAASLGVDQVFHGHHHDSLDYSQCEAPYAIHGIGLRGITNLSGRKVLAGELDVARKTRLSM